MTAPETADPDLRARWAGFAGSALLALGACGAGVLPRPDPLADELSALRTSPGRIICIVLAVAGMILLVAAWWRLRPPGGAGLTRTAFWWALPLALAPPLASRDVYAYAVQGLVWVRGYDPYTTGPTALLVDGPGWLTGWVTSVSPTWQGAPAPYGPLFFFVAGGAAKAGEAAGGSQFVTLALLRLAAVAGVLALAVLVPRLARACGVAPDAARWLVLLNPFLLVHLVSGAHNDALMLPLLAAALLVAVRAAGWRAVVAAGALLGLAAGIKIVAVVALPFTALLLAPRLRGGWRVIRAGAGTAAAAVAVFGGCSLAAGLDTGWIGALRETAGVSVQWTSIPTGWGLAAGWVAHWTGHDGARPGLLDGARAVGTVLTAVLLVALWWWALRRGGTARIVAASGWALLIVAVLGTAVHPWYALWMVVPIAVAGSDRVRLRVGIACAALCFLVLPDGFNLARVTVVPGVLLDLALTGAAIGWALRWARTRRTRTTTRTGTTESDPSPAPPARTGTGAVTG